MMEARGLIVAGQLIEGTEWCRRDEKAWWKAGERGTRARAKVRDLLCFHWTGGEAGLGSYNDDGPFVVRGMKSRLRDDGTPLTVGIDFVIGACDPVDEYAPVWQTCDIAHSATVHVGRGEINARAIGVEMVNAGLPGKLNTRNRDAVRLPVHGRELTQLRFYEGQLASAVRLAETLADLEGREGIAIPRRVPAGLGGKMSLAQLRRYSGAIEHLSVPPHAKVDAGTQALGALSLAGWAAGSL